MSDREGHGHKAIVYKSHFPPLRHSVVTETPADTLANKPRLTKDQALCYICPTTPIPYCINPTEGRFELRYASGVYLLSGCHVHNNSLHLQFISSMYLLI